MCGPLDPVLKELRLLLEEHDPPQRELPRHFGPVHLQVSRVAPAKRARTPCPPFQSAPTAPQRPAPEVPDAIPH